MNDVTKLLLLISALACGMILSNCANKDRFEKIDERLDKLEAAK